MGLLQNFWEMNLKQSMLVCFEPTSTIPKIIEFPFITIIHYELCNQVDQSTYF